MIFETLSDYFLIRNVAVTTQEQYRIAASMFDRWAVDNAVRKIEDVDEKVLSRFIAWYETRVSSPNTVRSKRRILLALFRFSDIELRSRKVRLVRPVAKAIDSWNVRECQLLIYAATKLHGVCGDLGTTKADYASCMLAVIMETALRRGDLPGITCDDIRSGSWQHVQAKTGRIVDCKLSGITQRKVMSMPHFGEHEPFAAWTEDHLTALSTLGAAAMDRALLEAADNKPLQKMRRSSITIQEREKAGSGYVQAGHASPSVTQRHYIDQSEIEQGHPVADWTKPKRA